MAGVVKILIETLQKGTGTKDAVNDLKDLEQAGQQSKLSFTELNSTVMLVQQGLQYARQAYDAIITPTIEYANQVRQLSLVSGESAEETSRFIQVLDDFKISSDDALTATRALTKEGYAPNIETLAQLSDQYLKITDAQERNEFVIKNLGRAGLGWVEVLNKGSDAIREMGDGVSDSLILNQDALDQAREYELALDDLSDAWEGLTYAIGDKAIPVLTAYVDMANFGITATQNFFSNLSDGEGVLQAVWDAVDGLTIRIGDYEFGAGIARKATDDLADANDNLTPSLEDAEAALKAQEQAAKEASDAFRGLLGSMQTINKEREDFAESSEKLKDQGQDIQNEITRENLAYGELLRTGEQTQEQIDEHIQKNDELIQKLEENREAQERLSADTIDASKERIAQTVEEGLAKDGINQQEFDFLQNYLVTQGLISQADADRAIAERAAAEQVIADYEAQNAVLDTTQAKLDALVNGSPYNIDINIETHGSIPTGGSLSGGGVGHIRPRTSGGVRGPARKRDSGGRGYAGEIYEITPEVGSEYFVPDTAGTFYPRGEKMPDVSKPSVIVNINGGIVDRRTINTMTQEINKVLTQ